MTAINALGRASSPYLLQHAQQPIHWQEWSESTLAQARELRRVIFLSIGYSTCHWCHVMAHECFDNESIASVLNQHFINIKVDREERPDIDATYMAYVMAISGQGGWPLNLWLTPEGEPLIGGTYFPPEDRNGRAGFRRICEEVAHLWRTEPARLSQAAHRHLQQLREESSQPRARHAVSSLSPIDALLSQIMAQHDIRHGGFGEAPKFPRPCLPRCILICDSLKRGDVELRQQAIGATIHTLRAMMDGGLHDHLGGGFHRYAVDARWQVPHFEKMLYDQAQLAELYLDAWNLQLSDATENARYLITVERIFDYVANELRHPQGGFYAAEDADSQINHNAPQRREGAYWTWQADEIQRHLSPLQAAIFCRHYGVEINGNIRPEDDPHQELSGQNVLHLQQPSSALAELFALSDADYCRQLAEAENTLRGHRQQRPKPHRDEKIITAWNALMIRALARGFRFTRNPQWLQLAAQAAHFLRTHLWRDGQLFRSFTASSPPARIPAFAQDYATLISALIELDAIQPAARWLDWAISLQEQLDARFWRAEHCGYVIETTIQATPILTIREDYDGAEPCVNHTAAENLLKLAAITHHPAYHERAEQLLRAGEALMAKQPCAVPTLIAALTLHTEGMHHFTIPSDTPAELRRAIHREHPFAAVFAETERANDSILHCHAERCTTWHPSSS